MSMGVLLKYFRELKAETGVCAGLLVYRQVSIPLLTVGYVRVATMGMALSGTFL
jgi:phage shock protein PspC (stress-responsive transcriptional regulator)